MPKTGIAEESVLTSHKANGHQQCRMVGTLWEPEEVLAKVLADGHAA